jgi:hypothetical protein
VALTRTDGSSTKFTITSSRDVRLSWAFSGAINRANSRSTSGADQYPSIQLPLARLFDFHVGQIKTDMKKVVVGMIVLLASSVNIALAQKPAVVTTNEPGWMKIGEITASFRSTNESIVVLGADEFESIRLKVTDAPLEIERLQVFYESGEMEDVNVANQLKAGGQTRVIKLEQPERDIKKVAFTYKTAPNYKGDKATVELHGLKTARQGDHNDGLPNGAKATKTADDVQDAAEKLDDEREEAAEQAKEVKEEAKEEAREAERDAERAPQKAERKSNETGSELKEDAANAGAKIKDKVYEGKGGPQGQTIYIDKHSRYYYINGDAKKIYITKSEMKDIKKR